MDSITITEEEIRYVELLAKNARRASLELRCASTEKKNAALLYLAELLQKSSNKIKAQNDYDLENAQKSGLSAALVDRLRLTEKSVLSMVKSLEEIAALPDPVGQIIEGRTLPNGLNLRKLRIPIGVIAIIFESRPNVTIDVGALGLKSANAVILRGGKEALESNKLLAYLFRQALTKAGLSDMAVQLVEKTDRQLMTALLRQKNDIDLVVPRGGEGLIQFVSENSLIPVVKHDKGVCHVFLHHSARLDKALPVIINSKTQRPGVCNAAETLLIDRAFPEIPQVLEALQKAGVTLRGDDDTRAALSAYEISELTEEGYHREYLAMEMSVKLVDSCDGAIEHIQIYNSGHSEAILAEDFSAIMDFEKKLDSAAIFINCSTRFHDGGQFGLGAEVGIATGKLHVRGPMGLADMTTTKYVVVGDGQIRT